MQRGVQKPAIFVKNKILNPNLNPSLTANNISQNASIDLAISNKLALFPSQLAREAYGKEDIYVQSNHNSLRKDNYDS